MEHKIEIWSNKKEAGKDGSFGFFIEDKITITEEELLEIILSKWKEDHEFSLSKEREYKAELRGTAY